MKDLLTYLVQSLVDHPDEVSVTERVVDDETVLEVRVADGDIDAYRRPEKGRESLGRGSRLSLQAERQRSSLHGICGMNGAFRFFI